jgi:hypothetical protein
MTRKDFALLAIWLAKCKAISTPTDLDRSMIAMLAKNYPNFDKAKFRQAIYKAS